MSFSVTSCADLYLQRFAVVSPAWFQRHTDAARTQRPVGTAKRRQFIDGVVQRIEEENYVESGVEFQRFRIRDDELRSVPLSKKRVVAGEADGVRRDIRADDVVAPLGQKMSQPTGAAAAFENASGRRGQQTEQRSNPHQVETAILIGKRFGQGMLSPHFADALVIR